MDLIFIGVLVLFVGGLMIGSYFKPDNNWPLYFAVLIGYYSSDLMQKESIEVNYLLWMLFVSSAIALVFMWGMWLAAFIVRRRIATDKVAGE